MVAFRGAPVLCVIHVVIEESTAVSEQKDGPFSFSMAVDFVCQMIRCTACKMSCHTCYLLKIIM